MKKRLLMMFALLAIAFGASAQSIFSENFDNVGTNEVPTGWIAYGDSVENAAGFSSMGIVNLDSWGGFYGGMVSVSWLSNDENADRWLITPEITIPADGEYFLRFKSYGYNESYPESWRVKLSTTGDAKTDFTDQLLNMPSLDVDWHTHLVSLAEYAGQTVRIAFVNYGNGYYGFLDDVEVGIFDAHAISLTAFSTEQFVAPNSVTTVNFTVQNTGTETISEFGLRAATGIYGDGVYDVDYYFTGFELAPYESYSGEFEMVNMLAPSNYGTYTYTLQAFLLAGAEDTIAFSEPLEAQVTVYNPANTFTRTVLVEDFVGMNVMHTPAAEQRLAEALAGEDNVVQITHHAGYYGDALTSDISSSMVALYGSSSWAPALAIDRTLGIVDGYQSDGVVGIIGATDEITNQIATARAVPTFVTLDITDFDYNATTRQLSLEIGCTATEYSDLRLNVYIVEDSIIANQNNAGTIDSFYVHNNVVRGALTDTWGDPINIVHETFQDGEYYLFDSTITYTLPEEWDASHCRVVAFLSQYGNSVTERKVYNATQTGYITTAEEPVYDSVTATIQNPQGGYIWYYVNDSEGNTLQSGRIFQETKEVTFMQNELLCVQFADINPMRQQSVIITPGAEYLDSVFVNGEYYALESSNDQWDEYGYRLYTICSTYQSDVVISATYNPYVITEDDTASATLVVVNHGNGYARRYVDGSQYHIANTQYYTLEEGEQFIFTFGSFIPGFQDWGVPDSAMRLLHMYVDGEEIDFNDTTVPGIAVYSHTTQGYSFYNYIYTQDSAKHRVEFFFGYYDDTTVCEPITYPTVSTLTHTAAEVMWMPSPSAEYYTVLLEGNMWEEVWEGNIVAIEGLSASTAYTVSIVSHCYNGSTDTVSINIATNGEPKTMTVKTNGGYLYSYWFDDRLNAAGEYTATGYEGNSHVLWAETETYDYANEMGTPTEYAVLEAIYVNGESIALDGSNSIVEVLDHSDEGFIAYRLTATFGVHDSIRFVFGPVSEPVECLEVEGLNEYGWSQTGFSISWNNPTESDSTRFVVRLAKDGALLVQDTVMGTTYTFSDLESATQYQYAVNMVCDGELEVNYITTITTGEDHTISIYTNGGYVRNVYGSQSFVVDSASVTAGEGLLTAWQIASFSADVAENYGIDPSVSRVEAIYVDGVALDLTQNDSTAGYRLMVYDHPDDGYTLYVLYVYFNADHTIQVVFGAWDNGYTVSVMPSDATLGTTIGGGAYEAGEVATAAALPQGGVTFVGWATSATGSIISEANPMQITVNSDLTLYGVFTTASLVEIHDTVYNTVAVHDTTVITTIEHVHDTIYLGGTDTVYLTDTVYITDTVYVGVDDVEQPAEVKLYSQNNQIVVEGAQGHDVVLYDAVGRRLDARRDDFGMVRFDVPATGTYLVRVGRYPARRIVVVR